MTDQQPPSAWERALKIAMISDPHVIEREILAAEAAARAEKLPCGHPVGCLDSTGPESKTTCFWCVTIDDWEDAQECADTARLAGKKEGMEDAAKIAANEPCADHHIGNATCKLQCGVHRTSYCPKAIAAAIRRAKEGLKEAHRDQNGEVKKQ